MNRADELAHKVALMREWDGKPRVAEPRWPEPVSPALSAQVAAALANEPREARRFVRDLIERDHMDALWATLEGEVDRQLIDTVGLTVGPREGESPADHDERLRAIASQFASMGGRTVPVRLSDERLTTLTRTRARSRNGRRRRRGDAGETPP